MDKRILLQTAISCMACDGRIDEEEIKTIIALFAKEMDESTVRDEVDSFNASGNNYLKDYLNGLSSYKGDKESALSILRTAVTIIKADNVVDYKEICFFKLIIHALDVPAEYVLDNIQGIDEDWVEDDFLLTKEEAYNKYFSSTIVPNLDLSVVRQFLGE